ncbi:MAG: SH3 domain-containing protein [Rhizobiaceae bacterium]|nr:SH3 domain-containing protein [Rhizobiaceae bacterium]
MNGLFNPVSRPNAVLPAAASDALRRHRVRVSPLPVHDGTGAAAAVMIAIGILVLAATVAVYFTSTTKQDAAIGAPVGEPEVGNSRSLGEVVPPASEMRAGQASQPDRREPVAEDALATFRPPAPNVAENSAMPADGNGGGESVVAVAETVEELLVLEEIQRREVEADLARRSSEITAAVQPESDPKVSAIATNWVNMRTGPSDDADVLMVVPGGANIQAETGCSWCAVSYDGRDGYIYKSFISYR